MAAPEVYVSNLRTSSRHTLLDKIEELLALAGADRRVRRGDLVAVKLHFGEKGNTGYLRPVLVRRVVEVLKGLGAKPFLTDTNTLYTGARSDAAGHLETAVYNGFDYASVGAPLVIADGLRGNSLVRVPIAGVHCREVSVAEAVAHADVLVGLAHFKGHELSGFGGALKNLGMGCAAREGKLLQHSGVAPKVKRKVCVACSECVRWCAQGAISVQEVATIDSGGCVGCGECILSCPKGAIQIQWNEGPQVMQEKMAEHALGAVAGKQDRCLFLNFATQVSPACDCCGHSDAPIVADAGILSSADPVALDQASVDLVNALPGLPGTALQGGHGPGEDKFRSLYPAIDWAAQLAHAERIGLGSRAYRRVDLPHPTP
ncbi:MAG: DUF362 domain-containing protein [Deferrisomatales bacterium]